MTTDLSLSDAVIASLSGDPRIPDAGLIAVDAERGIVTLRGTVESFSQRRAAELDHEIRGAALQSLMWDVDVPSASIDVNVHSGWVTLIGNVRCQYQSNAAYQDVARLYGVVDVTNEIKVNAL